MSSLTRSETARFLEQHDHFAILTHRRPDGDTIGSAATLCRGLRQLGKTAHIIENPEITDKFHHLHIGLTKPMAEAGDTLVSVDVASPALLPEQFRHLLGNIALRIDHHASATSFTEYELVEPTAGACAEVLYDVLRCLQVVLDKPMAEALYTAVATDTGGFRYANTTAHSFITAAACAEAGGDLATINRVVFDTNSFAKMKMQSWIIYNTRFLAAGKIAICAIPRAVEQQIGVTEDDMDSISGLARSIEGVKMAATLREMADGKVKVSVRAIPGYDAAAVCARFGGGGHKGAAGATFDLPLEVAAEAVAKAMPEM